MDPLAFIVYSMPVVPVYGKYAQRAVEVKNYHCDRKPDKKLVIMTGAMVVGKNIHRYRLIIQPKVCTIMNVFLNPSVVALTPNKNTSKVRTILWKLSIVFIVSREKPFWIS